MDGFDEKMGKLLSNPDAVSKVMELAKSLSDNGGGTEEQGTEERAQPKAETLPEGLSPAASPDLASLLGKLDPGLISGILRLAGEWGRNDDRRITLINALRPYVRSERRAKLDRAAEIVRLARLAKHGFGFLGGGERRV